MHIIQRERGLAHWRALNHLTDARLARLQARFASEQPALAKFISETATPDSHPESLGEIAAVVAEIFWREAGRPLATVTEPEIGLKWNEILDFILQFEKARQRGEKSNDDIVHTCHQSHLMMGVTISFISEFGKDELVPNIGLPLLRLAVDCLEAAAGGPAAAGERAWTADRVEEALSVENDPLRDEAVAAVDDFREVLAPRLLAELDAWISNPSAALEVDGSLGTHGLYLLAKWREPRAWPVFRRLLSLPGETPFDLTGDIITQDGPVLLASVVGGQRPELVALVENQRVNGICRNVALDALTCLVAWGEWPRAEMVAYLRGLLTGRLPELPANTHVFAGVVLAACDLEAWELLPEIEAAYQRGVVDEEYVDWETVLEFRAGRFGSGWTKFCAEHGKIENISETTSWFGDSDPDELARDFSLTPLPDENFPVPFVAPPKTGRNDPCPCGSGKKFKKCCGG